MRNSILCTCRTGGPATHSFCYDWCLLPGNSSECPPPGNAEDDTVCLDLGKCKDGKCIPFCEREQQLESCACNGEHSFMPTPAAGENMAFVCQVPFLHLEVVLMRTVVRSKPRMRGGGKAG